MNLPPRPSRSLAGKVAIVTGAGSSPTGLGNGRAISILLAEDQCSVVCVDLSLESAQATVELCLSEGKGGRAVAVQADVTKEDDCRRIVETTMSELGRVDILVNNVGILGPAGSAVDVEREEWARGLDVNVTSMMLMSKHIIPKMLLNTPTSPSELSIRGSIVSMASVAGLLGGTPSLLYPVSKGAVVQLTRAMASHHGKDGIRVNTVCPGMVYTPMVSDGGMSEETRQRRRERSLLQTEGSAWDAAGAVRYLAGGEARWVTGTVLTVDAGATCTTKF